MKTIFRSGPNSYCNKATLSFIFCQPSQKPASRGGEGRGGGGGRGRGRGGGGGGGGEPTYFHIF